MRILWLKAGLWLLCSSGFLIIIIGILEILGPRTGHRLDPNIIGFYLYLAAGLSVSSIAMFILAATGFPRSAPQ